MFEWTNLRRSFAAPMFRIFHDDLAILLTAGRWTTLHCTSVSRCTVDGLRWLACGDSLVPKLPQYPSSCFWTCDTSVFLSRADVHDRLSPPAACQDYWWFSMILFRKVEIAAHYMQSVPKSATVQFPANPETQLDILKALSSTSGTVLGIRHFFHKKSALIFW